MPLIPAPGTQVNLSSRPAWSVPGQTLPQKKVMKKFYFFSLLFFSSKVLGIEPKGLVHARQMLLHQASPIMLL